MRWLATFVSALLVLVGPVRAETATTVDTQPVVDSPAEPATPKSEVKQEPVRPATVYESSVFGRRTNEARITGSAHVVSSKALETFEHDDVQRVLKQVPGVYVREEDGFGLRPNIGLRGANSDRSAKVTLMEDGVLFGPAPYSAPAAYYFPTITRMEKVEVFKGPASVRSGPHTVGGAINLATRRIPEGFEGAIDTGVGTFGSGKLHAHAGYGGERFGLLVEGLRIQSDGFRVLDTGGNTGFEKHDTMLKAHFRSPKDASLFQKLELKLGLATEDSRETYLGLTEEDLRATPWRRYAASELDRMKWWRSQGQLSYTVASGESFELRVVAYRHDFQRTWRRLDGMRGVTGLGDLMKFPTGRNAVFVSVLSGQSNSEGDDQQLLVATNNRTFFSQGLQATGRWEFGNGSLHHELLFGARLHQDQIVRLHTSDAFNMLDGRMVSAALPTETTTSNTGSATALSLHALDEIDLGAWTLSPGLRIEAVDNALENRLGEPVTTRNRSATLLPGLGLAWQPLREWTLLAGVHRGYSPVSPGQPSEVKPESSINFESGVRWQERRTRAEAIAFWNRYSNLTSECTDSSGCADVQTGHQFNAGAVDVWGLEASGGIERSLGANRRVNLDASYTLTKSQFLTSFASGFSQFGQVREGDELPYVPVHQGALTAGLTWGRVGTALSGTYVGVMRDRAGQGTIKASDATDAQLVIDAVANVGVFSHGTVYAKATNLTDSAFIASRRPFGARAAQPRMLFIGYKHTFGG